MLLLFVWARSGPAQSNTTISLAQAIEATLRQHPLLHLQEEQVRSNRGALLHAQSQFDRVIQADASSGHTYSPLAGRSAALRLCPPWGKHVWGNSF